MIDSLEQLLSSIQPLDEAAKQAASERQNTLTKPPGSLGRLEEISIQAAGVQRKSIPQIMNKAVIVMAGDHGVVAEGVSAFPSEVTPQMVVNMLRGGAAINVLSDHAGARVVLVDMGVASDLPAHEKLIIKKVRRGTANLAAVPAMSRDEAIQSILSGVEIVKAEIAKELDLVATGEMGIGNTTPSAAIAVAISGLSAAEIVGRGTGVDDEGLQRKIAVVEKGIKVNRPDAKDGLDVLAKVGGFEIGGLVGVILGAAANRVLVVVDGFISTAAAMIAVTLNSQVKDYLIAGHCSQEYGHANMLKWLGLEPVLDLDLRLGEGTGAVLAMSVIEASCKILKDMATFEEAGVSDK